MAARVLVSLRLDSTVPRRRTPRVCSIVCLFVRLFVCLFVLVRSNVVGHLMVGRPVRRFLSTVTILLFAMEYRSIYKTERKVMRLFIQLYDTRTAVHSFYGCDLPRVGRVSRKTNLAIVSFS